MFRYLFLKKANKWISLPLSAGRVKVYAPVARMVSNLPANISHRRLPWFYRKWLFVISRRRNPDFYTRDSIPGE